MVKNGIHDRVDAIFYIINMAEQDNVEFVLRRKFCLLFFYIFLFIFRFAETHKYVSELLGKETISTTSYNQSKGRSGSYSINYQQSGRDMPYLFVKSSVALNLS